MFRLILYLYLTKDNFFSKQTQYSIQMKILFHKIHIVIPCSQVIRGRLFHKELCSTYTLREKFVQNLQAMTKLSPFFTSSPSFWGPPILISLAKERWRPPLLHKWFKPPMVTSHSYFHRFSISWMSLPTALYI